MHAAGPAVWSDWRASGLLARSRVQHPVAFKFTYLSYLNGDDIRSQCANGGRDILRFVYNGVYTEQVRTYDLVPNQRESGRFILESQVSSEADVSSITSELYRPDLSAPWRARRVSRVSLSSDDFQRLKRALTSSGFCQARIFGQFIVYQVLLAREWMCR